MTDDLRQRLRDELDSRDRPPMVGVVDSAVRQGRGRRRTRSVLGGGAATLGVATAVGLVLVGQAYGHGGPATHTAAQQRTAAPVTAKPHAAGTPATARAEAPTVAPGDVPATGTGILELLKQQLPTGTVTSHYGTTTDGTPHVEEYLGTPQGEAMLRVSIAPPSGAHEDCASFPGDEGTCETLPDGDVVLVIAISDNCIQSHSVYVVKPDGSSVQMDLSTCLDWNGVTNPASPPALTVDQAVTLLSDPRWDWSMSPSLVEQGALDFPTLTTFG